MHDNRKAPRTLPSSLHMITPSLGTLLELLLVAQTQVAGLSRTRPALDDALATLHCGRRRIRRSWVTEDRSVLSSFSSLAHFLSMSSDNRENSSCLHLVQIHLHNAATFSAHLLPAASPSSLGTLSCSVIHDTLQILRSSALYLY